MLLESACARARAARAAALAPAPAYRCVVFREMLTLPVHGACAPSPLAAPSAEAPHAVAGVVLKWTNRFSGYRRRLAVVTPATGCGAAARGGELRLYKLTSGGSPSGGPPGPVERTTVSAAAAEARAAVRVVGIDGAVLRAGAHPPPPPPPSAPTCSLAARMHIDGARIEASASDERRLSVQTAGGHSVVLRVDSANDRDAWIQALRGASAAPAAAAPTGAGDAAGASASARGIALSVTGGNAPAEGDVVKGEGTSTPRARWSIDSATEMPSPGLSRGLAAAPALHTTAAAAAAAAAEQCDDSAKPADAAAAAAAVEWSAGAAALEGERAKRRALLDYLRSLEEDKRELELRLLQAQAALASGNGGAEGGNSPMTPRSSSADGSSMAMSAVSRMSAAATSTPGTVLRSESTPSSLVCDRTGGTSLVEDDDDDACDFFDALEEVPPAMAALQLEQAGGPIGADTLAGTAGTAGADSAPEATLSDSKKDAPTEPGEQRSAAAALKRRQRLPSPIEEERSVSLWAIIKDAIGKDLTKICLPVFFNEPISALQKSAEEVEYTHLLDAAALTSDPVDRMALVAAFAVSGYASTLGRTKKPFNPLLGETYERYDPATGVRFLSEKVVHHPTTLAMVAEGNGWRYEADVILKSKFWGRSIEITPHGVLRVSFADGESFQWHKVVSSIHNLIIGKLYIDHYGTMRIKSSRAGLKCKLKFKESNILERNPHQVLGHISNANSGAKLCHLVGKWDTSLAMVDARGRKAPSARELSRAAAGAINLGGRTLWRAAQRNPKERYALTPFAVTLNELTPDISGVCPTDSRLRPDQRAQEEGRFGLANKEKQRLERKQRDARKRQAKGYKPPARWFRPVPSVDGAKNKTSWQYAGGYWEARALGHWESVRDIYGFEDSHWRHEDCGVHFAGVAGTSTLPVIAASSESGRDDPPRPPSPEMTFYC